MNPSDLEFTAHARDVLAERRIQEEWIWRTTQTPARDWTEPDGTRHFAKPIRERDGRVLHVVVNTDTQPNRIVTMFFDRRISREGRL